IRDLTVTGVQTCALPISVVLPPGKPSFVKRLREQDSLDDMASEARRALADGGIACAADADLASVLGAGCPAWSGGVISYHDMERSEERRVGKEEMPRRAT